MITFINKIIRNSLHKKNSLSRIKRGFHCKAPFNTLFFSVTGEVFLCLSNRNDIVGIYPRDSVREIFEGNNITQLRKDFRKNKGLPGCGYCKEQISLGNYDAAFTQFSEVSSPKGKITVVEFELSNRCNLSCVMCSDLYSSLHDINKRYLSPYDDDFIVQIKPYLRDIKHANFRGGEPFVIPLYYKLWEHLISENKNVRIGVTTNATIWSEKIEDLLKSGKFNISISVDTFNKFLYSKIRQNGSFEHFTENIHKFIQFRKAGYCNLHICTCIMTNNWMEMPEIFRYCEKNKLRIRINYVESPESLSIKYAPKPYIKEIIHSLSGYKNEYQFNFSVFNSILSILERWYLLPAREKSRWDEMEVSSIARQQFEKQKDIFYINLQNRVCNDTFNEVKHILEPCETNLTGDDDLFYFYTLLNKFPTQEIVDIIDKNSFNKYELEEKVGKLIEISKQKFTINNG